ncbi:MAG: haloacid dehalogenase [Defluviitaleaceae bacterium]|jgi:putative hydrolase of the HAD superfamily|nr:haloacid dehalogenase [Defluviitaleaceae bacterium]HHW66530.1 HAD family hydrolase [Candidatus Epulonipiscium sp.]
MYENYIFDLYGTLVDINTNEEKRRLWEKLALFYGYNGAAYKPKELKRAYLKEVEEGLVNNTKTKYPDIDIRLVFKKLYNDKGVDCSKVLIAETTKLFRCLSVNYIKLYAGVRDLLENLKAKGKKIYMLSNGQRSFTVPELKYLGIYDYFDGLYSSSDIGICKPDPAFFQYLINEQQIDISKSVFIGNDHFADVEGSKRMGLDCIYVHSNQSREVTEVDSTYQIWDGNLSKVLSFSRN